MQFIYETFVNISRAALTFLFGDLQPLIAKERRKVRVLCYHMKSYEQYFTIMADFSEIIWGTPVHLLRSKINEVCAWKLIWRVVRLSTYSIFLITGLEPIFLAG